MLLAWLLISMRLLSKNLLSRCGLGNGLVLEKVMLVEYEGGSVAGNVMPGPVVCLLRRGGFVVEVGDVTVDVVNLPDLDVDVVAVVVAIGVAAIDVGVVDVDVGTGGVDVDVVDVDVDVVIVNDDDNVNGGEGGLASETLDVGRDFSSIFSELEVSEDDGLDALDVLEETLSLAFSICIFGAESLLPSTFGLVSVFLPEKSTCTGAFKRASRSAANDAKKKNA